MKNILLIAGSDSGGGAGLQADLKTISSYGHFGISAVSALTAQNSRGITRVLPVDPELLEDQLEALQSDMDPAAVKIGMIGSLENAQVIARYIQKNSRQHRPVVIDPVLQATTGASLSGSNVQSYLDKVLLPLATLVTPNRMEAEAFLGKRLDTPESVRSAALALSRRWGTAVLVKGGHVPSVQGQLTDYLAQEESVWGFSHPQVQTLHSHGTGCLLSSLLACLLADGYSLVEAVKQAGSWMARALEQAARPGQGDGCVEPRVLQGSWPPLCPVAPWPLGGGSGLQKKLLYLIADLPGEPPKRLLQSIQAAALGCDLVQVRAKQASARQILAITRALQPPLQERKIPLLLNDRADLALAAKADGVHLGQSDLPVADARRLLGCRAIIGATAKTLDQAQEAQRQGASYLGTGALFATQTKPEAQRLTIEEAEKIIGSVSLPVFLIGGICLENVSKLKDIQAAGVCVSRGLLEHQDPAHAVHSLKALLGS